MFSYFFYFEAIRSRLLWFCLSVFPRRTGFEGRCSEFNGFVLTLQALTDVTIDVKGAASSNKSGKSSLLLQLNAYQKLKKYGVKS